MKIANHASKQFRIGLSGITDRCTAGWVMSVLHDFRQAASWNYGRDARELLLPDVTIAELLDMDIGSWLDAAGLLAYAGVLERAGSEFGRPSGWRTAIESTIADDKPPGLDWQMARLLQGWPAGFEPIPLGEIPLGEIPPSSEAVDVLTAAPAIRDQQRRALTAKYIDLIVDGVPDGEDSYFALRRVALSASQRGWTFAEFHGEISMERSNLRRQLRLPDGVRDRGKRAVDKDVLSAWNWSQERIKARPAFTKEHVRAAAISLLAEVESNPAWTATSVLKDQETYKYAIGLCARRGTTSPTLPVRAIEAATGIPFKTASRSLKRLIDAGLLVLKEKGLPGTTRRKAKASRFIVCSVLAQVHVLGDKTCVSLGGNLPMMTPAPVEVSAKP